jgi:hypothetical protein
MRRRALTVAVATAALLASGASPALGKGGKPPMVWNGSYSGVNYHPPAVGLVTRWSGSVRFDRLDVNRKKRIYNYIGTGSVTYTFSAGNLCSYSGTQTLSTSGDDASLTVFRKRSSWKYFLEIGTRAETITAQEQCPEQAVEELDLLPPYPLMTGRKDRTLKRLGSISGNYNEADAYLTHWELAGTPRGK